MVNEVISINITDATVEVINVQKAIIANEAGLDLTGELDVRVGPDAGVVTFDAAEAWEAQNTDADDVTSGGDQVYHHLENSGTTLIGYVPIDAGVSTAYDAGTSTKIYQVDMDPANGDYDFQMIGTIDPNITFYNNETVSFNDGRDSDRGPAGEVVDSTTVIDVTLTANAGTDNNPPEDPDVRSSQSEVDGLGIDHNDGGDSRFSFDNGEGYYKVSGKMCENRIERDCRHGQFKSNSYRWRRPTRSNQPRRNAVRSRRSVVGSVGTRF